MKRTVCEHTKGSITIIIIRLCGEQVINGFEIRFTFYFKSRGDPEIVI